MSTRKKQIESTLGHELVEDSINEAVGNWTQDHFGEPDPEVKQVLLAYGIKVANKVLDGPTSLPAPDFTADQVDWREQVSDAVFRTLDFEDFKKQAVPEIAKALESRFGDRTNDLEDGLWGYSLSKIANTAGCVAFMVANELDPDLLSLSSEEANQQIAEMTERLVARCPDKVMIVDPEVDDPADAAIMIQCMLAKEDSEE